MVVNALLQTSRVLGCSQAISRNRLDSAGACADAASAGGTGLRRGEVLVALLSLDSSVGRTLSTSLMVDCVEESCSERAPGRDSLTAWVSDSQLAWRSDLPHTGGV